MKLRDLCPWCCAKRPAPESDDEAYGDTASSGGWSSACESEGEPDRNSLDEALLAQEARADRSGVLDASKIELFGKIGERARAAPCGARASRGATRRSSASTSRATRTRRA